jgi:hypothetical protein
MKSGGILLRYGYIITLLMVLTIDSMVAWGTQGVMGGAGLFDGIIIWPAFTELVVALAYTLWRLRRPNPAVCLGSDEEV